MRCRSRLSRYPARAKYRVLKRVRLGLRDAGDVPVGELLLAELAHLLVVHGQPCVARCGP